MISWRRLTPAKLASAGERGFDGDAGVARGEHRGACVYRVEFPAWDSCSGIALRPRRIVQHPSRRARNRPAGDVDKYSRWLQQPISSTSATHRVVGVVRRSKRARRQRAHEVVELALDRGEIVENVGVVELEIVEHQRARMVVNELGALVEQRGVVFVGFDDKKRIRCRGAPSRRNSNCRHAADQITGSSPACSRIQASMLLVVVLP